MLNPPRSDKPSPRGRYQDEVPAVARAIRVLELLASSGAPRQLAELSREMGVGASSLLAILTTLRGAGLVKRDDAGRYQPGPGLAALGNAAARQLDACQQFPALAEQLVERFGETVLLWVRQEDTFVLATAQEGSQPLRYVPTPGLRRPARQTRLDLLEQVELLVEEEFTPGVWCVAVALPSVRGEMAAIALAGPRERLHDPRVHAALLSAVGAPEIGEMPAAIARLPVSGRRTGPLAEGTVGGDTPEPAGPIEGPELDAFLNQSLVATLSYLADDGYPATVPLWYAWDGEAFWLASRPGSEWAEHVRLDPRVSLAVSESSPPLRRVLARGLLAEVEDPSGDALGTVEALLAARYAAFDAAREPAGAGRGRLIKLVPERLIAWRGLLRYPKLPPEPESPGTASWRHLG